MSESESGTPCQPAEAGSPVMIKSGIDGVFIRRNIIRLFPIILKF